MRPTKDFAQPSSTFAQASSLGMSAPSVTTFAMRKTASDRVALVTRDGPW
jgi:hypothetical protein